MPSEIHDHTSQTKLIQLIFWTVVFSALVSASLGYNFLVTLILAILSGSVIAGMIFISVIGR